MVLNPFYDKKNFYEGKDKGNLQTIDKFKGYIISLLQSKQIV